MSAIGKIISAAPVGPHALEVQWDDGRSARVDFSAIIHAHKALRPLQSQRMFARVAVSEDGWSLEWPCDIDFGAAQVRRWADEQAGEIMAPDAFRAWMSKHGLTQEAAAQALGLSRRTIGYYLSGEQPIPKTVLLATKGWEREVRA